MMPLVPRFYGFQSYISAPIFRPGGGFFGTLCAIDPRPARLNTPETIGMFRLFAELIGLHNAVMHGAKDKPITVRAATDQGVFELSVSNSGDPIPAVTIERLFQPFFRAATGASQRGLGLGLYIASEIARAHGGELDVVSTPAETRFTFRMRNP
jgi:K+-sensing histidine kinase KdpD